MLVWLISLPLYAVDGDGLQDYQVTIHSQTDTELPQASTDTEPPVLVATDQYNANGYDGRIRVFALETNEP
jgi:hypothetical protein